MSEPPVFLFRLYETLANVFREILPHDRHEQFFTYKTYRSFLSSVVRFNRRGHNSTPGG